MCQCRWPTQTYIQKILQKHCFCAVFLHFFRQKHRNLHVFRHKVGPKHWLLQCFSMLWHPKTIQNNAIYSVFSFVSVFPLPEAYQNDPKFHFNTLLSSDTQKSSKKLANTTNTIPGLGAKSFLWLFAPQ